jgi:hypothetical protein
VLLLSFLPVFWFWHCFYYQHFLLLLSQAFSLGTSLERIANLRTQASTSSSPSLQSSLLSQSNSKTRACRTRLNATKCTVHERKSLKDDGCSGAVQGLCLLSGRLESCYWWAV